MIEWPAPLWLAFTGVILTTVGGILPLYGIEGMGLVILGIVLAVLGTLIIYAGDHP